MVTLDVKSVLLTSCFGAIYDALHSGKWSFNFKVTLPRRDSIVLATGEQPSDMEMNVYLRETAAEFVDWATERTKGYLKEEAHICGLLRYSEAYTSKSFGHSPASLMFEVWAPKEVIDSLVGFAQQGRHITQIHCDVAGLEYGWDPDGREKKWDNDSKEKSLLPIVNMTYTIPILEEPEPDYAENDEERARKVSQTPVGADLAPLLRESMKFQKWAFWLLAVIAGAVAFRGWH